MATIAEQVAVKNDMSKEQLLARIAELEKAQAARMTLSFKVSEKGALSVYGIQRFPVTLYVDQWERILGAADTMKAFAKEHSAQLQRKAK